MRYNSSLILNNIKTCYREFIFREDNRCVRIFVCIKYGWHIYGYVLKLDNRYQMTIATLNDPELLQMIRLRKNSGAEALYDRYYKFLSLAIFRIVRDKSLTDDLLEKTFIQIWDTIDRYNEHELPLPTRMLAIAKGVAQKHINAPAQAVKFAEVTELI